MTAPLLEVRGLTVEFRRRGDWPLPAVRGVDLTVADGEIVGLVGESGSGKSATMMAVMGLLPAGARARGSVRFGGRELIGQPEHRLRRIRGADIAMIFQDPMTTLNPLLTIGQQIAEAIRIHDGQISKAAAMERAVELLALVAIPSPRQRADQYPHEFSGGMRQRVVIAMAVANDPKLLIADEPTTALDVTIQAQIMELLQRLCRDRNMGLILVTHDLGVVASVASRIEVMYAGRVVERGSVVDTFRIQKHPYTSALLQSLPRVDARTERLYALPGAPPGLADIPPGCAFHTRCALAIERCYVEDPALRPVMNGLSACHRAEELIASELAGVQA